MALSGFGNALVPYGLIKTMKTKPGTYKILNSIQREISLVTRKTISNQDEFQHFLEYLKRECPPLTPRQ